MADSPTDDATVLAAFYGPHMPYPSPGASPGWSGPSGAREPSPRKYHPYHANRRHKDKTRRKMWTHALEKPLFNVLELTTLGQTQRRPIYIASLEAHIDRLHTQLLGLGPGFYPVPEQDLESLKGLNAKTCKGMVAGLHNDLSHARERMLELQRENEQIETALHAALHGIQGPDE